MRMRDKRRQAIYKEALKLQGGISSVYTRERTTGRAALLPVAVSYKVVKLWRPSNVPADSPLWLGRDWKYKEIRTVKRITSASVPDSRTINNDTTQFVKRNHKTASLRRRGELL